jgi:hypothetical protein
MAATGQQKFVVSDGKIFVVISEEMYKSAENTWKGT